MVFVPPFITGIVAGVTLKWGYDRLRLRRSKQVDAPSDTPATTLVEPPAAQNDLKRINGIGPVFEERLNAAGISSFAELAALPADRIREIIAVEGTSESMFTPESWIVQAQTLATEQVEE